MINHAPHSPRQSYPGYPRCVNCYSHHHFHCTECRFPIYVQARNSLLLVAALFIWANSYWPLLHLLSGQSLPWWVLTLGTQGILIIWFLFGLRIWSALALSLRKGYPVRSTAAGAILLSPPDASEGR